MTTALTVYMTNNGTSYPGFLTACDLITTSGSPSTALVTSKIGTASGWGEIYSQGNTNAWGAGGSIGGLSKNGWVLNSSVLWNNAIIAGNWTPTIKLSTSINTIVADIHMRVFALDTHSNPQIGSDMVLTSQTITTSATNFVFSATSQPVFPGNFEGAGVDLYLDIWLNITTPNGSSTATVRITLGTSASVGSTSVQLVTPGYSPTTSVNKDGSNRFKLSGSKKLDGKTRFLLYKGLNAALRFKAQGQKYKFAVTRFANAALSPSHDATVRLALLSANRKKDGSIRFKQVSGVINRTAFVRSTLIQATAVTVYMTVTNSSVLTTADTLISTSGSPSTTSKNTLIGTLTGWGEVYSRGTSTVWYGGSVAPLPSGNGYIWESSVLEGNVMLPGAWAANLRLNVSNGSIVADIHVRTFQKHGSTYTLIADMVAAAQTLTTTLKAISLTTTTTTTSNIFAVGDKLYSDVLALISTSSTNSGTATLKTTIANSSTIGSSSADILTAGYAPPAATSRNGSMRFKLSNARQKDAKTRFRLSVKRMLDGVTRLKIAAQRYKDGANRFRLSSVAQYKDGANRFRLSSITQYKNAATRFLTQGQQYKNGTNRFRLSSVTQYKNGATRFLSRIAKQKDGQARFLQRTPTQYREGSTRFKALLPSYKNGVTRFKQVSGTVYRSAVSRFKQSGSVLKNAASRFKLSGFLQRDGITRFRQSVPKKVDASTRLKAQGQQYKYGANRFRLNSPTRYRDANTRFRQSVTVLKDGISRFRQSVPVLKNASTRFKAISPTIYKMAGTRFRQSVPVLRNAVTRFRQYVPVLRDATTRIKTRVARNDDFSSRFRQNSVVQYHNANNRFRQSVPVLKNASTRLKTRFLQTPNASLRMRLSGVVLDNAVIRLLTRKQVQKDAITRLKLSGAKTPNAVSRLKLSGFLQRSGVTRFRQSIPKKVDAQSRLRTWGAPSPSFALRLRQRVNAIRSAVTRFRLSKTIVKNAACRLQTYHFNPRDGRIRFVLRPNAVSPISSATTEILFRNGTVEMVFRS